MSDFTVPRFRRVQVVSTAALFALLAGTAAADDSIEPVVDLDRNIWIPAADDREAVLRVGAVYNDQEIQIRYEFETDDPSWYHQYLVYEGGEWVRYGSAQAGPEPDGLYEDRISMMLDDGSVDGFAAYGGFITSHEGMRSLTSAVGSDEVSEHPYLGETLGRSDVRKFIPQSREGEGADVSWDGVQDEETLQRLREDGVFLDLWQWRAHRSNPVGLADNGYVLEYRHSSSGSSMFSNNWDSDTDQPLWMYDPDATGIAAIEAERLFAREYGQDDYYYLAEDFAVPFDPDHDWQDGDTLPFRFLSAGEGSRAAIAADGRWEDGMWRVRLTRTLEAPDPLDSKTLEDGGVYPVAFAVHEGQVGARWHLVSMPTSLGLGNDEADIVATRTDGDLDAAEVEWTDVPVMYPSQMVWQFLNSDHPGAAQVQQGLDVEAGHSFQDLVERLPEWELRTIVE